MTAFHCRGARRRRLVADSTGPLNGIDYLEVLDGDAPVASARQRLLLVRCLKPVGGLSAAHVRITGGVRVTDVRVLWAHPADAVPNSDAGKAERDFLKALPQPKQVLAVRTDVAGDFSLYTLRLAAGDEPAPNFDPQLSQVEFSFKAECPTDFDCLPAPRPGAWEGRAPAIDYLARDYASFRRLLLDRLATTMPAWGERSPADVGVALVELMAHRADELSYFQDAVATEAYLQTARRRPSVRRHARLLDYRMHEGCNARAFVCFAAAGTATVPRGTELLTASAGLPDGPVPAAAVDAAASEDAQVFATLHDLTVRAAHGKIAFYAWHDDDCELPVGATAATLDDPARELRLAPGDVLVFEERLGPETGRPEDADPAHRHAVRLEHVDATAEDPLDGQTVVEVSWRAPDALPFPLRVGTAASGDPWSLARGNAALVDHGRCVDDPRERLLDGEVVPRRGHRYRPRLRRAGLTYAEPYDHAAERERPAAAAARQDPHAALAQLRLETGDEPWRASFDLLEAGRFDSVFAVETETDGRARLRFGDGVSGRHPAEGTVLRPVYRVGGGVAGNVGSHTIRHVVDPPAAVTAVTNPLPASGGIEPESIERVRTTAPQAFREQRRAVTEADYAAAAEREEQEVQRATATRRWTGSWHTVFVTVDRAGGRAVDAAFRQRVRRALEPYRLAGHDVAVLAPSFVALDVAFTVCVAPGYFRGKVRAEVFDLLSNRDLPGGRRGFFHPDEFSFGEPVYLSRIIARAMRVAGVEWVDFAPGGRHDHRFHRFGEPPVGELEEGRITVGPLEIARLDNDPSAPENGRIELFMEGGL